MTMMRMGMKMWVVNIDGGLTGSEAIWVFINSCIKMFFLFWYLADVV
jgi:hypothetical protein